jgi:hypothetical protein
MSIFVNKPSIPAKQGATTLRIAVGTEPDNRERDAFINVFASMPCPLKVPFQQVFLPFMEQWNADNTHKPILLAKDSGCSAVENTDPLASVSGLPDIFIASAPNLLFSERFRRNLIGTKLYGGISNSFYSEQYSTNVLKAANRLHVGFLGFSSWGVVRDLTVKGNFPVPASWADLILPHFNKILSIHGCHDHAGSIALFLHLKKKTGETAIAQLAENILRARHFSELIKSINTERSVTPYYILPYSAIAHIPSVKHFEVLPFSDSIITPMMLVAKQSGIDEYGEVIRFFTGDGFKNMLSGGAYFQPDDVAGLNNHDFSDLDMLSSTYYENVESLMQQFVMLLGEKMREA